jgi:hypothetical protein
MNLAVKTLFVLAVGLAGISFLCEKKGVGSLFSMICLRTRRGMRGRTA